MIIESLLSCIVLVVLIVSSVSDLYNTYIPNFLSYGLIVIALVSRIIASFYYNDFSIIVYGLVFLIIGFVLCQTVFSLRLFGGGDLKILTGLFVSYGGFYMINFLFHLFFIGFLYSLCYYLATRKTSHFAFMPAILLSYLSIL